MTEKTGNKSQSETDETNPNINKKEHIQQITTLTF